MKIINKKINEAISLNHGLMLNLGAGNDKVEGYYNVDFIDLPGTDLIADLNKPLEQLPDNSVDAIVSRGSFEHIKNFMGLMVELHRVCKNNADINTIVPHFSNPYYYSDPTHVQPFGLYTMHYFMDESIQFGRKVPDYYTKARYKVEKITIMFYREKLIDKILEPILSRIVNLNIHTQDIYERRFCYLYPAWQIKYEMKVCK
ncbi:Methyltransferase type 11 [Methylophilaceae bacterium]